MKVKTVENVFKLMLIPTVIAASYLIIMGTVAIVHGEVDPFKGSLQVWFTVFKLLILFDMAIIIFGIFLTIAFNIKPEVETKITITPKVHSKPISITPKKKKP